MKLHGPREGADAERLEPVASAPREDDGPRGGLEDRLRVGELNLERPLEGAEEGIVRCGVHELDLEGADLAPLGV